LSRAVFLESERGFMNPSLWKSKTFWTGVAAIVGSIGAWVTGEIGVTTALPTIVTAFIGIFLRDAIANGEK
jgi:hypothetical protein